MISCDREARAQKILRDPRWAVLSSGAGEDDGSFYYSVKTTGIYCRPSCRARRPRPENVAFHASREAAERAGFRPCQRCRPDQLSPRERQAEQIARACHLLDSADEQPTQAELARALNMSPYHLHRLFKRMTGLTPGDWARARRRERLHQELEGHTPVTDAIYAAGYGSSGRFYAEADKVLGMKPSDYRAGGRNQQIRFAVAESALGAILVAQSQRGICAITLGEDPDALVSDLHQRFPKAKLMGGDEAFEQVVAQVVAFVERPQLGLTLPLDIQGTAFQQRVWQALREIPCGRTVSYTEIAASLGAPGSARAVAGACAANSLAVAVPCHRVVRRDGGLSGYRWGVERKKALLKREGALADE